MKPHSLVLVHGAGSGPSIFDEWPAYFPDARVVAADLQAGLDVGRASHGDYAAVVERAAEGLPRPLVLCGWSMGGLVALTAAARVRPDAIVLVESSPPAEVQGFDRGVEIGEGTFDPQEAYGAFPPDVCPRSESSRARAERKRGISVPVLPCAAIVVAGRDFPDDRGTRLAAVYDARMLSFPQHSHWDLIRDSAVRHAIAGALAEI